MTRLLRLLGALAMAMFAVAGAPQAHATTTICVALVVDDADLGGGVHTSCAKVPSGSTGYDVLRAGGHSFTVCSNGVLGTIDGKPADGCHVKDNSHYWSYWHRAPGASTWTYSSEGAGTYQPRNSSTEGWVWQNGSTRQPSNVPYSSICAPASTPTPTPTAKPTARTPRQIARPATSATSRPTTHRTITAVAATPLVTLSATAPATTAAPEATPTQSAVTTVGKHSSTGPSPALLAGGAVAAVIAAAAVLRQRRSP
jgi:hypothetical protein